MSAIEQRADDIHDFSSIGLNQQEHGDGVEGRMVVGEGYHEDVAVASD